MKLAFLGDSITQGCGAMTFDDGYVAVVGRKFGCKTLNYGIGGTRISKQKEISVEPIWDKDFIDRVDEIEKDSDFVFVFGGTNDYGHGQAKFGKATDKDPYTFCGAVNTLIEKLVTLFGKEKLCFILPCRRYNGQEKNMHGHNLKDYVDAIKSAVINNKIDYIDLYENGFPAPKTDKVEKYTMDGVHPNEVGHEYIADKVVEYLNKKGF